MINGTLNPDQPRDLPAIIVMAKRPIPSRVKTRLTPTFSPIQAAQIHAAMLECVLARLATHLPGRLFLALDGETAPPDQPPAPAPGSPPDPGSCPNSDLNYEIPDTFQVIDQGAGTLGERITHVWKTLDQAPAVFFGVDSPDIPIKILKSLWSTLQTADAAIGPVDDGGYWCLAAKQLHPQLLTGIDWGTPAVYHQTHQAAQNTGLKLLDLTPWHDVDTPADLLELLDRINHTDEPQLAQLRQRLNRITPDPQDTTR